MFSNFTGKIILGSTSPRRAEILKKIQLPFEVRPSKFDETPLMQRKDMKPSELVETIALGKADAIDITESELLITADTVIAYQNEIFGKPENSLQQLERLKKLNNNSHSVLTGVCIRHKEITRVFHVESIVNFGNHSDELLQWYVDSGDGSDKAGGYGTQSLGVVLVESINGCFFNIMGLPIYTVIQHLHGVIK